MEAIAILMMLTFFSAILFINAPLLEKIERCLDKYLEEGK